MDFVLLADGMNLKTAVEKRAAQSKKPLKRCLSPCKIFHTWCKNDGKCREKGEDCTWYCECPDNCEGFFCEKIVPKEIETPAVEVKVIIQKEEKKDASAFDKSKLAQALAGIIMKKQTREEEKPAVAPDTIDRVGTSDKITVKENVTATIILNCPPNITGPDATVFSSENGTQLSSNEALSTTLTPNTTSNNQSTSEKNESDMSNTTNSDPTPNVSVMDSKDMSSPLPVTTKINSTGSNNGGSPQAAVQTTSNNLHTTSTTNPLTSSVPGKVNNSGSNKEGQTNINNVGTAPVISGESSKKEGTQSSIPKSLSEIIEKAIETIPLNPETKASSSGKEVTSNNIPTTTPSLKTTVSLKPTTVSGARKSSNLTDNKQTSSTGEDLSVKGISISDKREKAGEVNGLYSARPAINLTSSTTLSHDNIPVRLNMSTDSPPSTASGYTKQTNHAAQRTSTQPSTLGSSTRRPRVDKTERKADRSNILSENKQSKFSIRTVTSQVEPNVIQKSKENFDNTESTKIISTASAMPDGQVSTSKPVGTSAGIETTTTAKSLETISSKLAGLEHSSAYDSTSKPTSKGTAEQIEPKEAVKKETTASPGRPNATEKSTKSPTTKTTITSKTKLTTRTWISSSTTTTASSSSASLSSSSATTTSTIATTVPTTRSTTNKTPSSTTESNSSVTHALHSTKMSPISTMSSSLSSSTEFATMKDMSTTFLSKDASIVTTTTKSISSESTSTTSLPITSTSDGRILTNSPAKGATFSTPAPVEKENTSTKKKNKKEFSGLSDAKEKQYNTATVKPIVDGARGSADDKQQLRGADDMTVASNKLPEVVKDFTSNKLKPKLSKGNAPGNGLDNVL